ncbi:unnamed protein product, partial [marine sediment metagenome]
DSSKEVKGIKKEAPTPKKIPGIDIISGII